MPKIKKSLFLCLSVILVSPCITSLVLLKAPISPNNDIIIRLQPGDNSTTLLKKLDANDARYNKLLCKILMRITGIDRKLKPGEYIISTNQDMLSVINNIVKRHSFIYKITIPEGLTNYQIIQLLTSQYGLFGKIKRQIPEGSLFPDTYFFTYGDDMESIITHMQNKQNKILDTLWKERNHDIPLKNKFEALILASIIEKETALDNERSVISGVFINRLKKNMPLQSDPTTIYAVSQGTGIMDRKLTTANTKTNLPHNTYYHKGLPPTPIANPGYKSIYAALHPSKTSALYFVANGTGGHQFAETLKEHINNIKKIKK